MSHPGMPGLLNNASFPELYGVCVHGAQIFRGGRGREVKEIASRAVKEVKLGAAEFVAPRLGKGTKQRLRTIF